MCTEYIAVAVDKEARQLGNGVDDMNATWEASENFTSSKKRMKTINCCFTEIKRKIWTDFFV